MRQRWTLLDFILIWFAGASFAIGAGIMVGETGMAEGLGTLVVLGAQCAATLVIFALLHRRRSEPISFGVGISDLKYVGVGMGLQILAALLIEPLARIVYPEDAGPPQQIGDVIANPDTDAMVRLAFFAAATLLAPLTEEILYRGVLFKSLRRWGAWLAIIVSSIVFAAVHITGLDPDNMAGSAAIVLPPLFLLAVLLAWLTERTGRLGPAFFVHSGWNLLAALILLIPPELLEQAATMGR